MRGGTGLSGAVVSVDRYAPTSPQRLRLSRPVPLGVRGTRQLVFTPAPWRVLGIWRDVVLPQRSRAWQPVGREQCDVFGPMTLSSPSACIGDLRSFRQSHSQILLFVGQKVTKSLCAGEQGFQVRWVSSLMNAPTHPRGDISFGPCRWGCAARGVFVSRRPLGGCLGFGGTSFCPRAAGLVSPLGKSNVMYSAQ